MRVQTIIRPGIRVLLLGEDAGESATPNKFRHIPDYVY